MSDTVTISCPSCSKKYKIKAALARQKGKSAKCRSCGSAIPLGMDVPAPAKSNPSSAPTPAKPKAKAKAAPSAQAPVSEASAQAGSSGATAQAGSAGATARAGSAGATAQASASGATATQLYKRGVSLAKSGKHQEAVASFDAAIQLNPDLSEAHLGKGLCLKKMGDERKSFSSLRKASRLGNAKAKQIISRDLGFGDSPLQAAPSPQKGQGTPRAKEPGPADDGLKGTVRKLDAFGMIKMLLFALIGLILLIMIIYVIHRFSQSPSQEPAMQSLSEMAESLQSPMELERYAAMVDQSKEALTTLDQSRPSQALDFIFEHYEAALNLWQALEADNSEALIGGLNRAHQLLPKTITQTDYLKYRDGLSLRLHMSDPLEDHLARLQQDEHAVWLEETSLETRRQIQGKAVKELTKKLWVRAALLLKQFHEGEFKLKAPAVPPEDIQAITLATSLRHIEDLALSAHVHVLLTWLEATMGQGLSTPDADGLSLACATAWGNRTPVSFSALSGHDDEVTAVRIVAQADSLEQSLDLALPVLAFPESLPENSADDVSQQ